MGAPHRHLGRPRAGLGTQLSALSLLVLVATLGAGSYATWAVGELRRLSADHAELDDRAQTEISLSELTQAVRADVISRYAGLPPDDRTTQNLLALQRAAISLQSSGQPHADALGQAEYTFVSTARGIVAGPQPTLADVQRLEAAADQVEAGFEAARAVLAQAEQNEVAKRNQFTARTVRTLGVLSVTVSGFLFGISWLIRRRLLRALAQLAATAQAVAAGDLSARTGYAGNDEVGRLARTLDETSDVLQQAFSEREEDSRRQSFRARLDRALAQVDDDGDGELAQLVERALELIVPQRPAELLIADSSESHLRPFAVNPSAPRPGCKVSTPWSCPAVRNGQMAEFASSLELDACPHLQSRPEGERSGTCIPVSFMGRVLGVLHSADAPGRLPSDDATYQLKALSEQTGARLGNLRAFAKIQRQAALDSLTGLPNRRSFEDAVRTLATRGVAYGVMLADLDHFKAVNDTYGHAAGDRALRLFSDVLRAALREHDLPCRFGGEEFAIVLPGVDARGAAEVGNRLRLALAVAVIGSGPPFTVSLGVADSTMARDLTAQLALADAALLLAKREGRDRCVVAHPRLALPHTSGSDHADRSAYADQVDQTDQTDQAGHENADARAGATR